MEIFAAHGYCGSDLRALNDCQMHLHALRLSDLCTADGSKLTDSAMGVQPDPHRSSPYTWPCSHRPGFKLRSRWHSALSRVFPCTTATQPLLCPLEAFPHSVSLLWTWCYSPAEQRLFARTDLQWAFYHVGSGKRKSVNRLYHHGGSVRSLPNDHQAAAVTFHGHTARLLSFGSSLPPDEAIPDHSFLEVLDYLPDSSRWAISEYSLLSDLQPIIAALALSQGPAHAISDGSFKDKFGTSALPIFDADTFSILGLNIVPGHPDNQSAYRSELAGLFVIVLIVNLLCSWANIFQGGIEVGCDGLSVLNKACDSWPMEPADPPFDLLSALCTMITASALKWTRHTIHFNNSVHQANYDHDEMHCVLL